MNFLDKSNTERVRPLSSKRCRNKTTRHNPPIATSRHFLRSLSIIIISVAAERTLSCHALRDSQLISLSQWRNDGTKNSRRHDVIRHISTKSCTSLTVNAPDQETTDHNVYDASIFPTNRPLLAIITETDACDTDDKMNRTYEAIRQAVSTNQVDLVSVRLSLPPVEQFNTKEIEGSHQILERACTLTEKLVQLSSEQKIVECTGNTPSTLSFRVVCSSDLVSVAFRARAHGIHFKEHHLDQLPEIVQRFDYPIVIGTSTHSVQSALESYFGRDETSDRIPKPHYYFVGTCYLTASHPEKTSADQLEGPKLPGEVKRALFSECQSQQSPLRMPRILAIGGIDECNCHNPVTFGADGVAVIRAVLQAPNPSKTVEEMQANMGKALENVH